MQFVMCIDDRDGAGFQYVLSMNKQPRRESMFPRRLCGIHLAKEFVARYRPLMSRLVGFEIDSVSVRHDQGAIGLTLTPANARRVREWLDGGDADGRTAFVGLTYGAFEKMLSEGGSKTQCG